MPCTAAWVTNSVPALSSSVTDIAIATSTVTCQAPVPMTSSSRSARNTPMATPIVTSATRRSRCP